MVGDDARRARHHDRAAGRARAGGEPGRPLGDPCLPPGGDPARAERAARAQPRAAVRGDGLRGRDRARLPALLPRARVQPGAPDPQRSSRAVRRRCRSRRQRCDRHAARLAAVRAQPGRSGVGGRRLRLVERDRRQGAGRLPASRRRRDRPRARDPAVRGRRRGGAARLRRRGRRRARRTRRASGARRWHSSPALSSQGASSARRSAACSRGSTSSSSSSPCSAS